MKTKLIIVLYFTVLCSIPMLAQTTEVEKTVSTQNDYLPKAGNFAIGVDATPIFDYLGNIFNNTVGNTLNLSRPAIYGKYYLDDKTAIRGVLALASTNTKNEFYVRDDAAFYTDPLSKAEVVDTKSVINNDYFTSVAIQKMIGQNKLRGFYGAQVLMGYQLRKDINTYGNPMSEFNPTPTSVYIYTPTKERPLEIKAINAFRVGVGGIAGFEYFVLPNLCFGGEISLNAIYVNNGQLYSKSEKVVNDQVVAVDKAVSPGGNEFVLRTFRFTPNGFMEHLGFYVMFHF